MGSGRVQVDEEDRRVVWRLRPGRLWLRGALFVLLGLGLPALVIPGDPPAGATGATLLGTAATAAWFVSGLRIGWELDEHGIETDLGRRRTTRLAWTDVRSLEVGSGGELVATTRDRGHVTVAEAPPAQLDRAVAAALELDLVPPHVHVAGLRDDRDVGRAAP